jgi:hypothetical protein
MEGKIRRIDHDVNTLFHRFFARQTEHFSARSTAASGPPRGLNLDFPAPQQGHFQASGRSSKRVPGGIFPFLSPRLGL